MKKIKLILSIVTIVISSILISSILISNNKEEPKAISKLDTKALNQFRADHIASIVNRNEEVKSNIVVLDKDFVIVGVTLKDGIILEKEKILLGHIRKNIYFTDGEINKVYITTNIKDINKIRELLKTVDIKSGSNNFKDQFNMLMRELTPIY